MTHEEFLTAIESMTVMELADLVKAIEEKFGVSAAAPVAVVAGGAAPAAAAAKPMSRLPMLIPCARASRGSLARCAWVGAKARGRRTIGMIR